MVIKCKRCSDLIPSRPIILNTLWCVPERMRAICRFQWSILKQTEENYLHSQKDYATNAITGKIILEYNGMFTCSKCNHKSFIKMQECHPFINKCTAACRLVNSNNDSWSAPGSTLFAFSGRLAVLVFLL